MDMNINRQFKRFVAAVLFLVISAAVIHVFNNIMPAINFKAMTWLIPQTVPGSSLVGCDFINGLYEPGRLLLSGKSPYILTQYPPLASVIGMLFSLVPNNVAYLIQVFVLLGLNIATLLFAVKLFIIAHYSKINSDDTARIVPYILFMLVLFMNLTSYCFGFSIERGNYDIYAQFFSVLGIWLLLSKPGRIWLPVIFVSLAVHCKLYPAILFVMVVWRYGWKSIIPIFVVNAVLFLMLGPGDFLLFVDKQRGLLNSPFVWSGNHSALSFSHTVLVPLHISLPWALRATLGLPVIIWIIGTVLLFRRGFNPGQALLFFALSTPLMNVIPSTSHDYKLVILYAPCLLLMGGLLLNYIESGAWRDFGLMVLLLIALGFIARSVNLPDIFWIQNKYPFVVLIEFVAFILIVWPRGVYKMELGQPAQ